MNLIWVILYWVKFVGTSLMSGVSALLNAIYNACHVERPDYNCHGMKYIVLAERNLIRK